MLLKTPLDLRWQPRPWLMCLALAALQMRPAFATILLGVLWAGWHLPLF